MVAGFEGLRPVLLPMLIIGMGMLGGCASAGGTMRAGDVADAGSTVSTSAGSSPGSQADDLSGSGPSEPPPPAPAPRNSAVVALQAQAERERAAGNAAQAAATLERAVRIDPADGGLWLALARLRLDQGQRELAVDLARRAESLAAPGSALRSQARDFQQQAATGAAR